MTANKCCPASGYKTAPRYSEVKKLEKKARAKLVSAVVGLHKAAHDRNSSAQAVLVKLAGDIAKGKSVMAAVKSAMPTASSEARIKVAAQLLGMVKRSFGGAVSFGSNAPPRVTQQDVGSLVGGAASRAGAAVDAARNAAGATSNFTSNVVGQVGNAYANSRANTNNIANRFGRAVVGAAKGAWNGMQGRSQTGAPAPLPKYTPTQFQPTTYRPTNTTQQSWGQAGREVGQGAADLAARGYGAADQAAQRAVVGAGQAINSGIDAAGVAARSTGNAIGNAATAVAQPFVDAKNYYGGVASDFVDAAQRANQRGIQAMIQQPSGQLSGPSGNPTAQAASGQQDPLAGMPAWVRQEFDRRSQAGQQSLTAGQVADRWRGMSPQQQLAMQQQYMSRQPMLAGR